MRTRTGPFWIGSIGELGEADPHARMPTTPTEAEGSTTVSEQAVLDVVQRWADDERARR